MANQKVSHLRAKLKNGSVGQTFDIYDENALHDTVNNLTTSTTGKALDAAQGPEINSKINSVNSALLSNIVSEESRAKAVENTLSARMDTFDKLPSGSTSGDAELIDIRVEADGKRAETAGGAVREQVRYLNGGIHMLYDTIERRKISGFSSRNLFDKTGEHTYIVHGHYRDYNNGAEGSNANHQYFVYPVKPGEYYTINIGNSHICFFSDYGFKNFISGYLSSLSNGKYTFQVPAGAVLMTTTLSNGLSDTFQLEKGGIVSPYQEYKFGLNVDKLIDPTNSVIYGKPGTNLFDKTGKHTNLVNGYYRDYLTGTWVSGEFYTALYDVEGGEKYSINANNVHVAFYSDELSADYVSGFLVNDTNGHTFSVPSSAKTMSLGFQKFLLDALQLQRGENVTEYEAFEFGISPDLIPTGKTLYVGTGKNYSKIQDAIDVASDGDVIYIDPGVYEETLNMVGKHLHLIGSGIDSTIVSYAGDDYYYPPLKASLGLIENMSFITTATEKADGAINTSYCVHIDFDSEENGELQFVNCGFESPNRHTVGIGLRENFKLNFTNCKFKSSAPPVYCHEQQASDKTGQRLELINCSIECTGNEPAIYLQESRAYSGNEMTILMQRCIAKSKGASGNGIIIARTFPNAQVPTGSKYLNTNGWNLDWMSSLNNETVLNS